MSMAATSPTTAVSLSLDALKARLRRLNLYGLLAHAEAILAERLARGEISPDDYRAAAAALRGDPGPPTA